MRELIASNASKASSKCEILSFPVSSGRTEIISNLTSLSIFRDFRYSSVAETMDLIFFWSLLHEVP